MYAHKQSRWGKGSRLPASHISWGARHYERCLIQRLLKSIKALHWRSWEMENKPLHASAQMCEWKKKNWWLSSPLIFMVHKDPDYKMQLVISEFFICLLGITKIVVCVCTRETGITLHCMQVSEVQYVLQLRKWFEWEDRGLKKCHLVLLCFGEKRRKRRKKKTVTLTRLSIAFEIKEKLPSICSQVLPWHQIAISIQLLLHPPALMSFSSTDSFGCRTH